MRVASWVLAAVIAAAGVVLFHDSAAARIRLNDAEIVAGVLVVTGHTRHRYESIALDDRAARKSDRHRRFVFRIAYYPQNCTVTLKTVDDERVATIASCGARGAQGTAGERGPAGPPGPSGRQGAPGVSPGRRERRALPDRKDPAEQPGHRERPALRDLRELPDRKASQDPPVRKEQSDRRGRPVRRRSRTARSTGSGGSARRRRTAGAEGRSRHATPPGPPGLRGGSRLRRHLRRRRGRHQRVLPEAGARHDDQPARNFLRHREPGRDGGDLREIEYGLRRVGWVALLRNPSTSPDGFRFRSTHPTTPCDQSAARSRARAAGAPP